MKIIQSSFSALLSRHLLLLSLSVFAAVTPAHAYVVGILGRTSDLKTNKPIHILVAGTSDYESDLFVQSAVTRARRYHEVYPSHQILILSTRDPKNGDLTTRNYSDIKVIHADSYKLTTPVLIKTVLAFKHVKSLDLYGHATLNNGFNIDDGYRVNQNSRGLDKLTRHFDDDAYATIHGCNSGFILAPFLSKLWKIPVAGMLTGTDFEVLHQDGQWYFNNKGESPSDSMPAKVNELSFSRPVGCRDGGCVRMTPTSTTYKGKAGEFKTGLGFMKFFCNFESGFLSGIFNKNRCEKSMAKALLSEPTNINANMSDYRLFARSAAEFLCPSSNKGKNVACIKKLMGSVRAKSNIYSSMRLNSDETVLNCSMKGCQFSVRQGSNGKDRVSAPQNPRPTTQINEFWAYLRGFEANMK